MPPKKVTKVDTKVENKKVETKKVEVKKDDKNDKIEMKGKKSELKDNKKWAEVTDDEYHDEDDGEQVEDNSSEKSGSESEESEEDGVIDEDALLESLKNVSSGIKPGQKNGKSVCDFDYEEIQLMDAEELSDYDTNTLIKVLMVRGTNTNNPILWSKSRTLLKLLNFEIKPNQPFHGNHNSRGGYRGARGGYRGGYRGDRGDRNERNDRYKPRENFHEKEEEFNEHEENIEAKEENSNWRGKKNWRGGRK